MYSYLLKRLACPLKIFSLYVGAILLHHSLNICYRLLIEIVLHLFHLFQFILGSIDHAQKLMEHFMPMQQVLPLFFPLLGGANVAVFLVFNITLGKQLFGHFGDGGWLDVEKVCQLLNSDKAVFFCMPTDHLQIIFHRVG